MGATSIDNNGLQFIAKHEDFMPMPYRDSAGNWTIGYGHLIKPNEEYLHHAVLTTDQGFDLFRNDLREFEGYVNRYVTRDKSQSEFNALVSLVYNIGPGNFTRSGLADAVQSRSKNAESKWKAFNKDSGGTVRTGLIKRRAEEWNMYNSGAVFAWATANPIYALLGLGLLAMVVAAGIYKFRNSKSINNKK